MESAAMRPIRQCHPDRVNCHTPYPVAEGFVESRGYILQDVTVNGRVLRNLGANVLQIRLLAVAREGDAARLIGNIALLHDRVGERRAQAKYALLFRASLFRLTVTKADTT